LRILEGRYKFFLLVFSLKRDSRNAHRSETVAQELGRNMLELWKGGAQVNIDAATGSGQWDGFVGLDPFGGRSTSTAAGNNIDVGEGNHGDAGLGNTVIVGILFVACKNAGLVWIVPT
jgi:hypothetical protein